jgi:hypothetical protein|nr:MAG TPA: hypothetical protein [Caudoviricetes sp.]
MNKELMQILSVINDGLRGEGRIVDNSPADNLCAKIGGASHNNCNAKGMYNCDDCPIGYYSRDGHATQIIQVFKQI